MDVEQTAAGKNLFEFILLQLVHASTARHHHRLDVQVVERVREAVEQHPVVGDDLLTLIGIAGRGLRIATTQVARWQHRLYADVVEHRLRR